MTSPVAIRGAVIGGVEPWSRWSNPRHRTRLESEGSEGTSRMPGRGIRLSPVIRYGVLVLALCLLLSDSFRLAFAVNSGQYASPRLRPAQSARTMRGPAHARIAAQIRHAGM